MTDLRVVENVGVRPLQPHAAAFQYDTVVGEAQAGAGVLFDQQDGSAAALHDFNFLDDLFERSGVQSHGWFIQQDHTRVEHEAACEFDQALLTS